MESQFKEAHKEAIRIIERTLTQALASVAAATTIVAFLSSQNFAVTAVLVKTILISLALTSFMQWQFFREAKKRCFNSIPSENERQWLKISNQYNDTAERLRFEDEIQNVADKQDLELKSLCVLELLFFAIIFLFLLAALKFA